MTKREIVIKLGQFGIFLKNISKNCLDDFCLEMKNRNYGMEETADAFLWFNSGWEAARKRLE